MNRAGAAAIAGFVVLLMVSIALAFLGYGRYVALIWATLLAAGIVSIALSTIVVVMDADPLVGNYILSLDPRDESVDVRLDRLDDDEYSEVSTTWGELQPVSGTRKPVDLALWFDREAGEAVGTWWQSLDTSETLGYIHKLDELYTNLEREAAAATRADSLQRTRARRGAQAMQRDHMKELDRQTIPDGESLNDVLDGMYADLDPDDAADPREGETDDLLVADERDDLDIEDDQAEDFNAAADGGAPDDG